MHAYTRYTLSPRVATDRPGEHHACVWEAATLGEAAPRWDVWHGIDEIAPLRVGADEPSLRAARKVWSQLTSDVAFDRAPAFVRFSNGAADGSVHHACTYACARAPLHLCTPCTHACVHAHATGATVGSVHQSRSPALKVKAEAIALQALLSAAARNGQSVVLSGDFNIDEADGGAGRTWIPGAAMGDDASRFDPIRRPFFDEYAPCIPPSYGTNLFPFTEHPQVCMHMFACIYAHAPPRTTCSPSHRAPAAQRPAVHTHIHQLYIHTYTSCTYIHTYIHTPAVYTYIHTHIPTAQRPAVGGATRLPHAGVCGRREGTAACGRL